MKTQGIERVGTPARRSPGLIARSKGGPELLSWTSPVEIVSALCRRWTRGDLLAAHLTGKNLFPMGMPLRRPRGAALQKHPEQVQRWIAAMEDQSRSRLGFGYELQWSRILCGGGGGIRLPTSVVIPSAGDALRLIGKAAEAERFEALARQTVETCPELRDWLRKNPLRALKAVQEWDRVLALVAWLRAHPRPNLYLRQIEIPFVDMTFVRQHWAIISELLDEALPSQAIDWDAGPGREFEERYGFLSPPKLIRVRFLDDRHRAGGFSDMSVSVSELAAVPLPAGRVFIVTSEVNGLAFPKAENSAVIFAINGNERFLTDVAWLRERDVYYWSDVSAKELVALNRLRATFPNLRSFLMDRDTLLEHQQAWTSTGACPKGADLLERLSEGERALFNDLAANRLGDSVCLDQERVSYGWLRRKLGDLPACAEANIPNAGAR